MAVRSTVQQLLRGMHLHFESIVLKLVAWPGRVLCAPCLTCVTRSDLSNNVLTALPTGVFNNTPALGMLYVLRREACDTMRPLVTIALLVP
jgi:hypothetical protein